jgi:hypothetical protein
MGKKSMIHPLKMLRQISESLGKISDRLDQLSELLIEHSKLDLQMIEAMQAEREITNYRFEQLLARNNERDK